MKDLCSQCQQNNSIYQLASLHQQKGLKSQDNFSRFRDVVKPKRCSLFGILELSALFLSALIKFLVFIKIDWHFPYDLSLSCRPSTFVNIQILFPSRYRQTKKKMDQDEYIQRVPQEYADQSKAGVNPVLIQKPRGFDTIPCYPRFF